MSDQDDEVPELDADARAFFSRHQQTGEPSAEAVERAKRRLITALPSGESAEMVRLAPRRRPLVPPGVMRAAAVVILLLAANAGYLVMRAQVAERPAADAEMKAVTDAWCEGEFEKASRLASEDCHSAACGPLSSDLAKMLGLAQRVDTLTADERDRLATFDQKIADGRESALKRKLKAAPPEAAIEARDLYLRAYQIRESNPQEAIRMFKLVIAMTAADDEMHIRAVKRLELLER